MDDKKNESTFASENNAFSGNFSLSDIISSMKDITTYPVENERDIDIIEQVMEAKKCLICRHYIDEDGGNMHCSKCRDKVFGDVKFFDISYVHTSYVQSQLHRIIAL